MNVSFLIFIIIILKGKGWERWMPEGEKRIRLIYQKCSMGIKKATTLQ